MERNLGELSYNPKTLIPMYSGQGPNQFWQFMQSKIRQNIVSACYNDALTVQQISLETGIPLPYLDDEIKALEDKQIIIREGNHYKANVIVMTSECIDEIDRAVAKYHVKIADEIALFIKKKMEWYKQLGFAGCDFSENSLRWQMSAILFGIIFRKDFVTNGMMPKTGWGEHAYLWFVEKMNTNPTFSFCDQDSKNEDRMYFFDYWNNGNEKGNYRDFDRNERYTNIFCDICRGEHANFGEYDLEAIAEMIKKGYVIKTNGSFQATVPIYTAEQFSLIEDVANQFVSDKLSEIIREMDHTTARILSSHTPKHLQDQVNGIASTDKFRSAVCFPVKVLIDREFLSTVWHPLEMPTTYVVLKK